MSLNTYHHAARQAAPGRPLVFTFHGAGGDLHLITGPWRADPAQGDQRFASPRRFRAWREPVVSAADRDVRLPRISDVPAR